MALSHEENEMLTRVGPGTPAGEMLRRYWHPIAFLSELEEKPLRRRILGEDLCFFAMMVAASGCLHFAAHIAGPLSNSDISKVAGSGAAIMDGSTTSKGGFWKHQASRRIVRFGNACAIERIKSRSWPGLFSRIWDPSPRHFYRAMTCL